MIHPSRIAQPMVDKVVAMRGQLHAHGGLDPKRMALIVIDLNTGSVERNSALKEIVPLINAVASALKSAGGSVAWVTSKVDSATALAPFVGAERARLYFEETQPGTPGSVLWPGLEVGGADLLAMKTGHSAFFPGKCDLHERLRERGIDSLLVAGTVTNVCCESSARDAYELGYRVTMISDANVGHSFGAHEASLASLFRNFADVRPSEQVIELIRGASPQEKSTEHLSTHSCAPTSG